VPAGLIGEQHTCVRERLVAEALGLFDAAGVILDAGPSAGRVLGYRREDLVGRHALELVHPDDAPRCREAFARLRETPRRRAAARCGVRTRYGSWQWVEGIAANRLADPTVGAVVINARDVTRRVRLEERLRHSRKLAAVGRRAAGVAHDLNNLLTVIMAHGTFLLDHLPPGDPARRDAEGVVRAGERAGHLTGRLLGLSRRDAVSPTSLDLNSVVADTAKMLGRLIGEDIELAISVAPEPAWVLADAGQIERVVMNLTVNARDAMAGGGRLAVGVANVSLDGRDARRLGLPAGRYSRLAVSDSGCGMDAEVRAHLFEPFFTTKEEGRGTGLGLATIHGIVTRWGGGIQATSQPGRGSTFEVYLPRAPLAEPGGDADRAALDLPSGAETLRRAEDDERLRTAPG
jgi:PAS domain S-box-containing protein